MFAKVPASMAIICTAKPFKLPMQIYKLSRGHASTTSMAIGVYDNNKDSEPCDDLKVTSVLSTTHRICPAEHCVTDHISLSRFCSQCTASLHFAV